MANATGLDPGIWGFESRHVLFGVRQRWRVGPDCKSGASTE